MLKNYLFGGKEYQFEEGKQPAGAVELTKTAEPISVEHGKKEAAKPPNKSRKVDSK